MTTRPPGPGDDDDNSSNDEQDSLSYFEESLQNVIEDSVLETIQGDGEDDD